jgi:hypothetical protein
MRDDNRLLLSSSSEMTVRRDRTGDRPCCDQNLSIIGPPTWRHAGGFRCIICDRNVGWIKHSCAEIIRERLAAGEPMPFSMKEIEQAALARSCLPPSARAEQREQNDAAFTATRRIVNAMLEMPHFRPCC